ncbi:hypothetical protein BJ165DRAFT_1440572 [Panaeolus papilionaceus]|nr:hypothetical protein BJ165DRAFT_1440572 [Panaeolus papilionaceus]
MGSVAHPPLITPPRSSPYGQSDAVKFPITERSPGILTPIKPAPPSPHSVVDVSHNVLAHPRPPHLPFRRISLPSPPPMIPDRTSMVSVGSFEVYAEDGSSFSSPQGVQLRNHRTSAYMGDPPMSGGRRRSRARRESSVKPEDRTRIGQEELKMLAKRQKIIEEFYETEKAYVDGLELIYSHFLTPIISSLDDAEPLLNRSILTSIFSNFIDIWNLHHSFFAALSLLLVVPFASPSGSSRPLTSNHPSHQSPSSPARPPSDSQRVQLQDPAPPLSPLLLSHFPYLSLYTPFITSFPSTISSLTQLTSPSTPSRPNSQYNSRFAGFLKEREADTRCGRLKLRDWLLTIVQRCPRYLMLIKDLISCTPRAGASGESKAQADDEEVKGEAEALESVLKLVTKITEALNTALRIHAQTLSLVALQKSCTNLPPSFHLVSPGRTLVKRGELVQVESKEKAGEEKREVLLFSDCLVWFSRNGGVGAVIDKVGLGEWDWDWDWGWSSSSGSGSSGSGTSSSAPTGAVHTPSSSKLLSSHSNTSSNGSSTPMTPPRPSLSRSRSRSDAQLASTAAARFSVNSPSSPLSDNSSSTSNTATASSTPSTPAPMPSKRRSMYGFGTPRTSPSPLSPLSQSHINPHPNPHARTNSKLKTPDPPLLRRSMVAGPAHSPSSSAIKGSSGGSSSTSTSTSSYNGEDKDKWTFKGKIDLINLDIVVGGGTALEDEDRAVRRFEVMSPEGSFVLYAESQSARDEWTTLIRSSKSQVMSSINMSNPYSTLTSSNSKEHVRRALVALPYEWGDERLAGSLRGKAKSGSADGGADTGGEGSKGTPTKDREKSKKPAERRRKIDHYVPAIWIPDRKTNCCMRCGKLFGWRRRRHHCRLCGRCVCGGCSGRTFFITDAHAKDEAELAASSKPARACDACYDAVFPVVDSSEGEDAVPRIREASRQGAGIERGNANGTPMTSGQPNDDPTTGTQSPTSAIGTIGSLMDLNMNLNLPSWLSVPSISSSQTGMGIGVDGKRGVEGSLALMAIDADDHNRGGEEARRVVMSRRTSRVVDARQEEWDRLKDDLERGVERVDDVALPPRDLEREKRTRIRLGKSSSSSSSHLKMRSYQAILEGFKARDEMGDGTEEGDDLYFGDFHETRERDELGDPESEKGANGDDTSAGMHERPGDGSADSISGDSGWETDDVDCPDGDLERVHEGDHHNANLLPDAQYSTPPPKPRPSGHLPTSGHPYAHGFAYSPSSSRYSLSSAYSPMSSTSSSPVSPRRVVHNLQRPQRREDTARRSKRFSLPAIGVHAASVTAHTSGSGSVADSSNSAGVMGISDSSANVNPDERSPSNERRTPTRPGGMSKRLSLVLMGRNGRYELNSSGVTHPGDNSGGSPLGMRSAWTAADNGPADEGDDEENCDEVDHGSYGMSASPSEMGLGKGLAAAKLSELLEKSRSQGKA